MELHGVHARWQILDIELDDHSRLFRGRKLDGCSADIVSLGVCQLDHFLFGLREARGNANRKGRSDNKSANWEFVAHSLEVLSRMCASSQFRTAL